MSNMLESWTHSRKRNKQRWQNLKVQQMFVKVLFLPARFPCFIVYVNRQDVGTWLVKTHMNAGASDRLGNSAFLFACFDPWSKK